MLTGYQSIRLSYLVEICFWIQRFRMPTRSLRRFPSILGNGVDVFV